MKLIILTAIIGAIGFVGVIVSALTATPNTVAEHRRYERWKERKRNDTSNRL